VIRVAILAAALALGCATDALASEGQAVPPQAIEAYSLARSYAPGETARIELLGNTLEARILVFHAGLERSNTLPTHELLGTPVRARVALSTHEARVAIGDWQSGLYFARISSPAGHAYAPFVVRPRRFGEHRIAVVLPTNTWAAYNFRDENRDGVGDTWYADPKLSVELDRPFARYGAPPHFAQYDLLFLRWLARTGKQVDVLSDDDLERVHSGAQLTRLYDLVVFSGHHEYFTSHEYDVTESYRDRGGNLMFLSANNFFYRVVRTGSVLHRVGRWRDLGRPEAALVGIQYLDWNHDEWGNAAYVVRRAGWPFTGTPLVRGSRFGTYGIEIDAPTKDSPKGLHVLATVPNVFGRGRSATMTYYTTPAGAKVFAAGTINFGGTATWQPVAVILENVWARLARP
jgi:N,N-dimethylformamidase beta subunit-like protein